MSDFIPNKLSFDTVGAMDEITGAIDICLDELSGHNPRVGKLIHPDIHFVFPVAGKDKPVSDQFARQWRELLLENP